MGALSSILSSASNNTSLYVCPAAEEGEVAAAAEAIGAATSKKNSEILPQHTNLLQVYYKQNSVQYF